MAFSAPGSPPSPHSLPPRPSAWFLEDVQKLIEWIKSHISHKPTANILIFLGSTLSSPQKQAHKQTKTIPEMNSKKEWKLTAKVARYKDAASCSHCVSNFLQHKLEKTNRKTSHQPTTTYQEPQLQAFSNKDSVPGHRWTSAHAGACVLRALVHCREHAGSPLSGQHSTPHHDLWGEALLYVVTNKPQQRHSAADHAPCPLHAVGWVLFCCGSPPKHSGDLSSLVQPPPADPPYFGSSFTFAKAELIVTSSSDS